MGNVIVGLLFITNVVPEPVCDAILVAFPIDVIGPVRFAFVATVEAEPVILPTIVPLTVRFDAWTIPIPFGKRFKFWFVPSVETVFTVKVTFPVSAATRLST